MSDTIFALSSGRPPSGVAVIRLSGPRVRFVLETIVGEVPSPRLMRYATFRGGDGAIDRGMAVFFPGPASFTGEDSAELHCHGGRAVVSAVLARLGEFPGLRMAEAGEFSQRAFLNGKFDLTEAEALADLITAETEAQRRFALSNSEGRQSALYATWRERIAHARAMVEAELDFSDEGDVPGSVGSEVWTGVARLAAEIGVHMSGYRRAEIIRDGFSVVIAGAPNVGKSSLLNVLAQREAAIVSDEPGTTRDVLDVTLDINGDKVVFSDTAGLRDKPGTIEAIGIERARVRLAEADLVLLLEDHLHLSQVELDTAAPVWRVRTKSDLNLGGEAMGDGEFAVSSVTGEGIALLLARIGEEVGSRLGDRQSVLPSRTRHILQLQVCRDALEMALSDIDLELRAEELRRASDALGRIAGRIDVEHILGIIFSKFCVGK